jgi:hypothetical protein
MEKKTIGIITVIITTCLCCLPGVMGLCLGSLSLIGSLIPDPSVPSEDIALIAGSSIMILGVSLVFITIPIGVGIWTWYSHKSDTAIMEQLSIPEDDF